MADLKGANAKLRRAQHHLDSLRRAVETWRAENPEPFRCEDHDDNREWTYHWVFDPIPDNDAWSSMLGDFVHNLRSALDHLTWQLVLREGNAPGRGNEFPIFESRRSYTAKAPRKLEGITDPAAIAFVERFQPFNPFPNWTGTHPLWVVHELDRVDKHQTLHVVAHGLADQTGFAIARYADGSESKLPVRFIDRAAKHDAVFAVIQSERSATEVEVNIDFRLEAAMVPVGTVNFGGKIRLAQALDGIIKVVAHILSEADQTLFQQR